MCELYMSKGIVIPQRIYPFTELNSNLNEVAKYVILINNLFAIKLSFNGLPYK